MHIWTINQHQVKSREMNKVHTDKKKNQVVDSYLQSYLATETSQNIKELPTLRYHTNTHIRT